MRTLGVLCQRRRSETSKLRKCSTAREKTREGFSKTQTREEEASTLEGVKSITRDEAPSVINQRKTLPKKRDGSLTNDRLEVEIEVILI
ncbi:unnamed protein product [Onchocerca flexuosa]|uniref:Uncharacterized protein n=1 Tax=Onchocerca flexuosa TaxID=387005 RepID=A0A183H778_9BILA|nr:unnamed protein product [Onchocerca flexuosa]